MHQRHVSGGQGDRHAGRHQGALERLERHVLGGDQIGARVPGVGVPQLDRMAGIKRFDQDFGVFGLVICLVERHQAAHSSHTGWPSSVTYASWLRCLTRKHSEQMNSSFCMGMTVTEASSLLRSAPGSS